MIAEEGRRVQFCKEALRGDRCYSSTRIEFQCQIHVIGEQQPKTVIMMIVMIVWYGLLTKGVVNICFVSLAGGQDREGNFY